MLAYSAQTKRRPTPCSPRARRRIHTPRHQAPPSDAKRPHLAFHLDEAIEKGAEMIAFIDEVIRRDQEIAAQGGDPDPLPDDTQ